MRVAHLRISSSFSSFIHIIDGWQFTSSLRWMHVHLFTHNCPGILFQWPWFYTLPSSSSKYCFEHPPPNGGIHFIVHKIQEMQSGKCCKRTADSWISHNNYNPIKHKVRQYGFFHSALLSAAHPSGSEWAPVAVHSWVKMLLIVTFWGLQNIIVLKCICISVTIGMLFTDRAFGELCFSVELVSRIHLGEYDTWGTCSVSRFQRKAPASR